jgi:hypothetical protein
MQVGINIVANLRRGLPAIEAKFSMGGKKWFRGMPYRSKTFRNTEGWYQWLEKNVQITQRLFASRYKKRSIYGTI